MLFATDSKIGVWCEKWIPAIEAVAKASKSVEPQRHKGTKEAFCLPDVVHHFNEIDLYYLRSP